MKFTKEEVIAVEVVIDAREEDAVAQLSDLELSLIGGGQGEVTLH